MEWSERIEKTNGDSTGYVKMCDEINVGVIRKGGHLSKFSMAIDFVRSDCMEQCRE